jgi:excisionase family DNA binding protein
VGVRSKVTNLARHEDKYVTVAQLAEYWQVSRKQIYKHIDAGTLEAVRLGPRLYRIRTVAALVFEERAQMRRPSVARPKTESRDR